MTLDIQIIEDHSISLSGHYFGLKSLYGIEPSLFIAYYENLIDKYSLNLNKIEFVEEYYVGNEKEKGIIRPIQEYVAFIIYSNILEQKGIEIKNLIKQIKQGKDYYEIRHARSLAELIYIYHQNCFDIEFLPKGPDFIINNIKADLKVIQPYILGPPRKDSKLTKSGSLDVGNEIILEISKKISSRFLEGCRQADLIYFDFTGSLLFSSLDIFIDDFHRIIQPRKYRLIFYNTSFFPHGHELYHKLGDSVKFLGKITFPNLLSFKGYPADFDPYLWKFLSKEELF